MQHPTQHPLPNPGTPTPALDPPERLPAPAGEPDFAERNDDPEQAEELERQQDA